MIFALFQPMQARRQRGSKGGNAPPIFGFAPRFISCPPDLFLAPPDLFLAPPTEFCWEEKSSWFWPKKTFEFVILARKSLPILAKTFFGDHLIFTENPPQTNSGIIKKLCPPDFNFAPPPPPPPPPPDLAKLATPLNPCMFVSFYLHNVTFLQNCC